ncbi:hypothetical protein ES703_89240 [subsurface metagenome]
MLKETLEDVKKGKVKESRNIKVSLSQQRAIFCLGLVGTIL